MNKPILDRLKAASKQKPTEPTLRERLAAAAEPVIMKAKSDG